MNDRQKEEANELLAEFMPAWQVWLRWLAVLPGALLGAVFLRALAVWGLNRELFFDRETALYNLGLILVEAVFGGAFVRIAISIAPRRKLATAVAAGALVAALAGGGVILAITQAMWWSVAHSAAAAIAAVAITVSFVTAPGLTEEDGE